MRQVPRRDAWLAVKDARGSNLRQRGRLTRWMRRTRDETLIPTTKVQTAPKPLDERALPAVELPEPAVAPARHGDVRALVEAGRNETVEAVRLTLFERAFHAAPDDPMALSFYGLTIARVRRNWSQGIAFCEEAIHRAGNRPELLANLALAWLVARNRREAARMLTRLASMHPTHPRTEEVRLALGRRRRPVLPFLPRGFFLNRWLGRLRHRRSHAPAV